MFFSARLAVDTFLWLGAFLLTHGAIVKMRELGLVAPATALASPSGVKAMVALFYVNRVLRLLPLYAACLFFWWHVSPRLGSGPFW